MKESILDVLLYLFEHYFTEDAAPPIGDRAALSNGPLFNELTQAWHLTHSAHHHPVALQVLLWLKIMAFTLFRAFSIHHGQLFRLGKVTLQELRKRIYRSLLCGEVPPFFSG